MKPTVTFIQSHLLANMLAELKRELPKHFKRGESICIKCHMGEYGNLNYLRPPIVGAVVEELKAIGAKPFIFDSPTVYKGSRYTTKDYYNTARKNGFTEETIGCPIVISDEGKPVKSEHYSKLEVCKKLVEADGMITLSHFKGHDLACWGGAIKNLGMGAVTASSKGLIHDGLSPLVHTEKCLGCGICVRICPEKLISLKNGKACINSCFGCGACILACPNKAIQGQGLALGAGLAEATRCVLSHFDKNKLFFVNVLLDISNHCDCLPIGLNEPAISHPAPNVGITISSDPVAVDKASLDLANKATHGAFSKLWPADPNLQIEYGIKFKLGSKDYELKEIKC